MNYLYKILESNFDRVLGITSKEIFINVLLSFKSEKTGKNKIAFAFFILSN
jgi:hypothetical protein